MKLKFRPESLDPHLSGSSDRIHEEDQIYNFSDLSSEDHCPPEVSDVLRVSTSSTTHLATNEDHKQPAHIPMFIQVEPEVIPSFQSSHSKDRYLSPAEMVPVEKSTDLCFEGTEPSINLSFPEDNFQSWKSEENATGTFSSATLPGVPAESQPEIPEEHQTYLCEDNSTSDTLSSQEVDPAESSLNCRGVTEEASIQSIQIDLTHFGQASSVESTQSENIHPQSLSDLTPEMVKHVRHFCFEEILPVASQENFETPTDEKKKPQTCELFSEKALTPNDPECLDAQPISVQPRAEMPLSTTDEGSHISPEYAETSSTNDDYTDKISMKSLPRDSAKSLLETAKEQLNILGKENFSSDILQSQEESALVTNDSRGAADEVSTQSNQDVLAHLGKAVSVESTQSEDLSSQTFSDLTPQTVKHVRHFCFEEMLPSSSSGESSETPPDEARPRISRQFSEERLSPVNADYECLDSQTISLQSKEETTSSTSDDESHMSPAPEYAETSPTRNNDTDKFSALSLPRESMKAQCKTSEDHLPYLYHEDTKTDIQQSPRAESASLTDDSRPEKATFVESTQSEKISSQSLSDLTPDTVENVRHFCFEELLPFSSQGHLETPPDELRSQTSGRLSEDSPSPVHFECFIIEPMSNRPDAVMAFSTIDEGSNSSLENAESTSTTENYTDKPPEYSEVVHKGTHSPTFEYSDPEPFFDCRQAASDFSEPDEPDANIWLKADQSQRHLRHSFPEKLNRRVLLSSGSEDYEDAPFLPEPPHNVDEESKELLCYSEESDEEFSLCETAQPPPVAKIGTFDADTCLTREIIAELGSMSESSDEEFLTTRIVRRRVVIQGDEMPNLPTQSVTEEKYKDENGHVVVKKVTRKIVRKCVSVDGLEHEEVSIEGAPQQSISMAEGDGYSKVVKRTVLKSEGDHTEVTFAEGFSASKEETAEGGKVRHTERTTVLKGERTMTHHGDQSLASDLPSAKDDFKQALGYISGFSGAELPHVVERQTVKEDGTVVRRAHMHKGRTLRQTVVKGAGQHKHVLLKHVGNHRKGSKTHDLQQHLHQLFHHYCKEDKEEEEEENTDEDRDEEEE